MKQNEREEGKERKKETKARRMNENERKEGKKEKKGVGGEECRGK